MLSRWQIISDDINQKSRAFQSGGSGFFIYGSFTKNIPVKSPEGLFYHGKGEQIDSAVAGSMEVAAVLPGRAYISAGLFKLFDGCLMFPAPAGTAQKIHGIAEGEGGLPLFPGVPRPGCRDCGENRKWRRGFFLFQLLLHIPLVHPPDALFIMDQYLAASGVQSTFRALMIPPKTPFS